MQTIITKFHGPTAKTGVRYSARAQSGIRVRVEPDHGSRPELGHAKAARALCQKIEWDGEMVGGWIDGNTMVWVFTESPDRFSSRGRATRDQLLSMLRQANRYLQHPEVEAISFALKPYALSKAIEKAIEAEK